MTKPGCVSGARGKLKRVDSGLMVNFNDAKIVERIAVLECPKCKGSTRTNDIPCTACLNHWGKPNGRLCPRIMPTCTHANALFLLVTHPLMVSLKHTSSDFYQVQWGSGYGAGDTPLLAIEKAILSDLSR